MSSTATVAKAHIDHEPLAYEDPALDHLCQICGSGMDEVLDPTKCSVCGLYVHECGGCEYVLGYAQFQQDQIEADNEHEAYWRDRL